MTLHYLNTGERGCVQEGETNCDYRVMEAMDLQKK